MVSLARELQKDGIPVSLTIQFDSARKNGQDDSFIQANVSEAINFYQPDGIVHGRSRIIAADPTRTRILGNLRFKDEKEPAECRAYPWHDRVFFRGHTAEECDPRVWSEIETLIRNRLPSPSTPPQNTVAVGDADIGGVKRLMRAADWQRASARASSAAFFELIAGARS